MPLGPGSRLDSYELVSPLGSGGMGEVWLATEVRLGRKVAVKLLPDELTRDPQRVSRFEQEARTASALNHPNVCTILALGQAADGQHYLAMEYVDGETLRTRLGTSRLTLVQSLDIAVQIASALVAAQAAGIVHRDIKPENVMLRPDGLVKVLDFGLAKITTASTPGAAEPTRTAFRTDAGSIVGTVAYMSPEQARGQPIDARTDIWSSGCVLYEMVAGRSTFGASSSGDTLAAILGREPPPLARFEPDVPAELQRIVSKALRKDRAQRYQTAQDLLLDLQALREEVQAQRRSGSSPATPVEESGRAATGTSQSGPRRWRVLAGAALAVLAIAVAAAAWWSTRSAPRATASSAPVQRNLTRLTFGPGLQTDATFSPDGRFIAYASDRAGNFDIWVQPTAGGEAVQVTRSEAHDTQPDWSPDGSTIVFRSERAGGGLFDVPALGGLERQLTSVGTHPSWSPDGREILFLDATAPGEGTRPLRMYALSVEDNTAREVLGEFFAAGSWSGLRRIPTAAYLRWAVTGSSAVASSRSRATAPTWSRRSRCPTVAIASFLGVERPALHVGCRPGLRSTCRRTLEASTTSGELAWIPRRWRGSRRSGSRREPGLT
jgi:eukaryotic-like serine/threonine-protein kinase